MISKPLVLVLGAGASHGYGFPLGSTLRKEICSQFWPDGFQIKDVIDPFGGALKDFGFSLEFMRQFGHDFYHSSPLQIDAFLELRPEFETIGKLAIAASLIPHELDYTLFRNEHASAPGLYGYLFGHLFAHRADFGKNCLSIVTFNYDRSLEYFMFKQLRSLYKLNDDEAFEMLKCIPIVHVYGELSAKPFGQQGARPFFINTTPELLQQAIEGIKLVPEGRDDLPSLERARKLLTDAKQVCVLGFGWDATNIKRLDLATVGSRIRAMAFGKTEMEARQIARLLQIQLIGSDSVKRVFDLESKTCVECMRRWALPHE